MKNLRNMICILFMFNFTSAISGAEICDLFKPSMNMEFTDSFPLVLDAGQSVKLNMELKIKPSLKSVFDSTGIPFIALIVDISNNIEGSKSFFDMIMIKSSDLGAEDQIKQFQVDLKTTEAMYGKYFPVVKFSFSLPAGYCFKALEENKGRYIQINNSVEKADLNPPSITKLTYNQSSYFFDEVMILQVNLKDKSLICTEAMSEANECSVINHVAFQNVTTKETVDFFPPLMERSNGNYEVEIDIVPQLNERPLFKPGKYRIIVFDISDYWGNLLVDVPTSFQKEFEVLEPL